MNNSMIKYTDEGRYELLCPICKQSYRPTLPIALDDFIALANSFRQRHGICTMLKRPASENTRSIDTRKETD